jgi:AcrR family transcriptional regulator
MKGRRKYEMRDRARAYDVTRRRIIEATFEMHGVKGVAATTFSDVAARAGVAPATVTRHFPAMGDLVRACGGHVWEWLAVPDPDAAFDGVDGRADRVRRLVQEVSGVYARGEAPLAGARRDRGAVPELDAFLGRLDAELDRLVRLALAPLHPRERHVRLALALLDFGVWESLRRRGLDAPAEMEALLGTVLGEDGRDE